MTAARYPLDTRARHTRVIEQAPMSRMPSAPASRLKISPQNVACRSLARMSRTIPARSWPAPSCSDSSPILALVTCC
jgi:hypothetical protein